MFAHPTPLVSKALYRKRSPVPSFASSVSSETSDSSSDSESSLSGTESGASPNKHKHCHCQSSRIPQLASTHLRPPNQQPSSGPPLQQPKINTSQGVPPIQPKRELSQNEELQIRAELLYQLKILLNDEKSQTSVPLDYSTPTEVLAGELKRLQHEQIFDDGLDMSRQVFLGAVSVFEHIAMRQKVFDVKLKGWSSKMLVDVQEDKKYDIPLLNIYKKHVHQLTNLSPKSQLLLLTIGSAAGYHSATKLAESAMKEHAHQPTGNPAQQQSQNHHHQQQQQQQQQYPNLPTMPNLGQNRQVPQKAGPLQQPPPHSLPQIVKGSSGFNSTNDQYRTSNARESLHDNAYSRQAPSLEEVMKGMNQWQAAAQQRPPSVHVESSEGSENEYSDILSTIDNEDGSSLMAEPTESGSSVVTTDSSKDGRSQKKERSSKSRGFERDKQAPLQHVQNTYYLVLASQHSRAGAAVDKTSAAREVVARAELAEEVLVVVVVEVRGVWQWFRAKSQKRLILYCLTMT